MTRTLRLKSGKYIIELAVEVVDQRSASGEAEITRQGDSQLQQVARENGGTIPITSEECQALLDAKLERLLELAQRGDSNLRHLFPASEEEAAHLQRLRRAQELIDQFGQEN